MDELVCAVQDIKAHNKMPVLFQISRPKVSTEAAANAGADAARDLLIR